MQKSDMGKYLGEGAEGTTTRKGSEVGLCFVCSRSSKISHWSRVSKGERFELNMKKRGGILETIEGCGTENEMMELPLL